MELKIKHYVEYLHEPNSHIGMGFTARVLSPGSHQTTINLNSLAPGRWVIDFKIIIIKLILRIDTWSISCDIALGRMPQNPFRDKSTLVQVMAWCRQATSHYLDQCWLRSMTPHVVTRPQWVNTASPRNSILCLAIYSIYKMCHVISLENYVVWVAEQAWPFVIRIITKSFPREEEL